MYTEKDYRKARWSVIKAWLIYIVPWLLVLCLLLIGFVDRWKLNSRVVHFPDPYEDYIVPIISVLMVLAGILILYKKFVPSAVCYAKHVKNMLNGTQQQTTGQFLRLKEELYEHDGVVFLVVVVNVNEQEEKEFYFDLKKNWQPIKVGAQGTIQHNDMFITDFRTEE